MKKLLNLPLFFAVIGASLLLWHHLVQPLTLSIYQPQQILKLSLNASFEPQDDETNIYTFIPSTTFRQSIVDEQFGNTQLPWAINNSEAGRMVQFSADGSQTHLNYQARLLTQAVQFEIDPLLTIPKYYAQPLHADLLPSDEIQVYHPEIRELWQRIKPADEQSIHDVLQSIYNYTLNDLAAVPFKGTTDALTAARLGMASCNGKSRLFVALARLNNIPARLVGGFIFEQGDKRTSHQWAEAYVGGHWIPFGVTNGYFASLPAHYIQLYIGDETLFRYTRNINFDYLYSGQYQTLLSALIDSPEHSLWPNLVTVLTSMSLSDAAMRLLLLLPICTLIIAFCRNVVGISSFGTFLPMLIAAAMLFVGLATGAFALMLFLVVAISVHSLAEKLRLLKTARLALVISTLSCVFILILWQLPPQDRLYLSALSVLPVVIIAFMSEKMYHYIAEQQAKSGLLITAGTMLIVGLCFLALMSDILFASFATMPELYLLVIAALLYLGGWSGLRLSEMRRFKGLIKQKRGEVVGMNARNRNLVYARNEQKLLRLAADKLESKIALAQCDVAIPGTIAQCQQRSEVAAFLEVLTHQTSAVIKPNNGSKGKGILVITSIGPHGYVTASGRSLSQKAIKEHVFEILNGSFAQNGEADIAYIEPLIVQAPCIQKFAPYGLSDIRVIVSNGHAVAAMLRMPTKQSGGKANLAQGAIGVAVDMQTGKITRAAHKGKAIERHPDSGENLFDIELPDWQGIVALAERCYQAVPLGYLGVDICLDASEGALVLEINGRPGLEIQNVNNSGLAQKYHPAQSSTHSPTSTQVA